jgi:hypothetical protein
MDERDTKRARSFNYFSATAPLVTLHTGKKWVVLPFLYVSRGDDPPEWDRSFCQLTVDVLL